MYIKAIFPTIFLAGQAINAVALPATTVRLHSVITRTTIVPATTESAGSNPNNVALPAIFSSEAINTPLAAPSSFSDAAPSRAIQTTITVTQTATETIPFPVFITVKTDTYYPTPTSEAALPRITFVTAPGKYDISLVRRPVSLSILLHLFSLTAQAKL
jgi:hypothetical protein